MSETVKPSRRQQILEALAVELEQRPGVRITTAALARSVGVSEAALYRHFPSKARMFEALFEFAEDSVFGLLNRIQTDGAAVPQQLEQAATVVLKFAELNPGITRCLLGEALVGEHERLRDRADRFFERFETQLRRIVNIAGLSVSDRPAYSATRTASLICAVCEGRMARYSRTGFRRRPTEDWAEEWAALSRLLVARDAPG